jgi:U3 small nucleolar RNA-associated protein 20
VEFYDILTLLPAVSSEAIISSLLRIVEDCLDVSDPHQDFETSFANATWTLAASLKALSTSKNAHLVPVDWLEKAVEKWSWSSLVLESIADTLEVRKSK